MRVFFQVLLAALTPALAGGADTSTREIRIAMREDTPPFVSIDASSGAYVGYFYEVCTEAVTRAGFQFTQTSVSAKDRNNFLKSGIGGYDLLCDPTTVTLSRMNTFARMRNKITSSVGGGKPIEGETIEAVALGFSQIIFVANGAYAIPRGRYDDEADEKKWRHGLDEFIKLRKADEAKVQSIGASQDPPAETLSCKKLFNDVAEFEIESDNEASPKKKLSDFIIFRFNPPPPAVDELKISKSVQILGYVTGSTISERVFEYKPPNVDPVACEFDSHEEAAAAFCGMKIDRYYGDLDIIRASIAKESEKIGKPCPAEESPQAEFSYEPYAFVVSSRIPDFPEKFTCALYSMFEDGTIQSHYTGRFDAQMSSYLRTLFRINSIPVGKRFSDGDHQSDKTPWNVCGSSQ